MLVLYDEELLAPCPIPKLEDNPYWLSTTAYSIYLQPPSIPEGCFLYLQSVVTGTHITWQQNYVNVLMNLTLLLD
jgi:hypothetical protein